MQTAADECSLAMRRVDRLAEQSELVVHRGAVRMNRRRDVLREQLELEPPVAPHDTEAAPLAGRSEDRRAPVDLDAHRTWRDREGPVARDERHRHRGERRRTPVEQLLGCVRAHSPDIDAGDLGAVGEPVGRAGEEEGYADREQSRSEPQDRDPGPETGADD